MSTRLVILGLLREQPRYGYEIKQEIENRMGDWTSIAFGSIYFALNKLEQENLIEKVAIEQDGGRPSRSIYQINVAGQAEFLRLLRELWRKEDRQYFAFDLAVYYLDSLPREEIIDSLSQRIQGIEQALAHLEEHQKATQQNPYIPPLATSIFEHTLVHLQTEARWLIDLRQKVVNNEI